MIADAASATAAAAYTEVLGSLRVLASAPSEVSLPALTRVTGSVTLALPGTLIAPTIVARCGMSQTVRYDLHAVALPALREIGGNLEIEQTIDTPATTAGEPIELGMPALVRVGGDVSVSFGVPAPAPCGLAALAQLPGNLTLDFATADVGGLFLNSLADIAGEVTLRDGFSVLNVLPALVHAGSLRIENAANLFPSVLPVLSAVDGSVELVGIGGGTAVRALSAAGSLSVIDTFLSSLQSVGSSAGLTLGGLTLTDNEVLASLTAGSPATSAIDLTPAARLTILSNPALSLSEICTFVALQRAQGWVGTPDLGGQSCP